MQTLSHRAHLVVDHGERVGDEGVVVDGEGAVADARRTECVYRHTQLGVARLELVGRNSRQGAAQRVTCKKRTPSISERVTGANLGLRRVAGAAVTGAVARLPGPAR